VLLAAHGTLFNVLVVFYMYAAVASSGA